jgi:hypothetical protein
VLRKVLFVAGQPGSAAYFEPLWREWLKGSVVDSWKVLVEPGAFNVLDGKLRRRLPLLEWAGASQATRDIDEFAPTVVISSAHKSDIECGAMSYAQRVKAGSIQIFDTWYDYFDRAAGSLPVDWFPDYIAVIDKNAEVDAAKDGLPADRLVAVGNPAWEDTPALPDADTRTVLFLAQPIAYDEGEKFGYTENTAWQMLRRAQSLRADLIKELLYAPHPRMNVTLEDIGQGAQLVSSTQAGMEKAGTIIGMYSAALVEAYLAGRTTLTLQPSAIGPDRCLLSRNGTISRCQTVDEIICAISDARHDRDDRPNDFKNAISGSRARLENLILGLLKS